MADHRSSWTGPTDARTYFGEWLEVHGMLPAATTRRLVHGGGIDRVVGEVDELGTARSYYPDAARNVTHVGEFGEGVPFSLEPSPRRYEAFGALRAGSSSVDRGFAGRPVEGDTGLVYLRARHYDPATGRFLQTDPLGVASEQLYAYARSNPFVFGDPLGLEAEENRETRSSEPRRRGSVGSIVGGAAAPNGVGGPVNGINEMSTNVASQGQGVWLYPSGRSQNVNDYRIVILNGVNVERASFQQRVNELGVAGFYNPTNGLARDVVEAARQKFDGANDSFARQFSQGLQQVDHPIRIIAHSQGTLTVANAAQYHGLPEGSHIEFRSPAISTSRAEAAANTAGATYNYTLPYGDAAALWAPSLNPIKRVLGAVDLILGAPIHTSTDP